MPENRKALSPRSMAIAVTHTWLFRAFLMGLLTGVFLFILAINAHSQTEDSTAVGQMISEAQALSGLFKTELVQTFLAAVPDLPHINPPRIIFVKKEPREYLSETAYLQLDDSARNAFEQREMGETFYYYTRYGTPLVFARPLELLGQQGLSSFNGARIVDFGFGSIGQLRLMASLGAEVVGIEVDPILEIIYNNPGDTGTIPRATAAEKSVSGSLSLRFGSFPSDPKTALQSGVDAFISKNTLKRGYIHPEKEVDPRMLVHLGVDDSTYVKAVYDLLKPGGFFLIYNLHPARSRPTDEKYIPWSDGRCPFDRALLESTGFDVVVFDADDTEFARSMGTALGWGESMNFETDLFGTYTLLRKKS